MRRRTPPISLAAMVALAASGGFVLRPSDHSRRDSNRMKLTEDELSKLSGLSGKDKKAYIKLLRGKYKCNT